MTLTFVCVDLDLDRALFNKHSKTWNKDALVGLNRSQPRFLVKISTKVVNEIQVVLTFSLPCTMRHLYVVIVDDPPGVALNIIHFDFKHKQ